MYGDDFNSFKPVYFFELSNELYEKMDALDSNNSSIQRTIVSRLYYAAFLHARSWLVLNENYESHSAGDHYYIPQFIMKAESLSFKTREILRICLFLLKIIVIIVIMS